MSTSFRLEKNDSSDIAFSENCLMAGAISQEEFRNWLFHIIENSREVPSYVFDLVDLKDMREIFKGANGPVGFYPSSDLNSEESDAIDGIAYKRGHYDRPLDYDVHISREDALKALEMNPHIEKRFRETFPFIEF